LIAMKLWALPVLAGLLSACASPVEPALPVSPPPRAEIAPAPPVVAQPGIAGRMLTRINEYRRRAGLGPLSLNAALDRAAGAHAADMAAKDYFAHEAPDGSDFARRAGRAGYRWRVIGENIAAGLTTPEATVDGWMDSDGHRRNMLSDRFTEIGVGHVFLSPDPGKVNYGHYWVLMLGTPAAPAP
jgi:uncharacterized protein YkwD